MYQLFLKHKLFILLFLLCAVLVLNIGSENIRGTTSLLLSPIQSFLWGIGSMTSGFLSGDFQGKIQELETENQFLSQQLLSFNETEKENNRLRKEFLSFPKEKFDILFVEIIGKEIERDVLFLNKGASEGVKQGMPVITQSNVAVGSIGEVFEHTSKVLLFSLRDNAFDVKIQEKEAIGVLRGQGRYHALLDLIPKEEELEDGDIVVTSVLGGIFPDNLLVGKVKYVQKSDLTAFQGGDVELFFHPGKENSLFILINNL